jgi:hypothetical protein
VHQSLIALVRENFVVMEKSFTIALFMVFSMFFPNYGLLLLYLSPTIFQVVLQNDQWFAMYYEQMAG